MSDWTLEIASGNGRDGGDARPDAGPKALLLVRDGDAAELIDRLGDLAGEVALVRMNGRGCSVIDASGQPLHAIDEDDWKPLDAWKLRLCRSMDSQLAMTFADQKSSFSPEIHVMTHGTDKYRRLTCRLPVHEGEELIVGRRADAELLVDDAYVSRRHLRIFVRRGRHLAEDLGSRWGTKLNGRPLTGPAELKHEDVLRIGKTRIEFRSDWQLLSEQLKSLEDRANAADAREAADADAPTDRDEQERDAAANADARGDDRPAERPAAPRGGDSRACPHAHTPVAPARRGPRFDLIGIAAAGVAIAGVVVYLAWQVLRQVNHG